MTSSNKDIDAQHWTDPSDYGLPFVEVTPLKQAQSTPKSVAEETPKVAPIDVKDVKKQTIQSIKVKSIAQAEEPVVPKAMAAVEKKKSSNTWIWIAASLALAVVAVILLQMNSTDTTIPEAESAPELVAETTPAIPPVEEATITNSSTSNDENQSTDNQSDIANVETLVPTPDTSPQNGTTIDNNATGTIVRVTERGERPQFYIVVGSLPSEAMALKEAAKYYDRTQTIYLIMPYEDSKNYRLAINRSIGFTAMTEELQRVKDQYQESLWILKY